MPGALAAQWQIARLIGEPAERFVTTDPLTQKQSLVHIAQAGLKSLKRGLEKAGIGAETFELRQEADGPFGWRDAIAINPKYALAYYERGDTYFDESDMARALTDLKESSRLSPNRIDTELWLYLVERRSSVPTDLAQNAKLLDGQEWPGPVIHLLLGTATGPVVLAISRI